MYENEWQIDPPKQLDRGVKRGAEQERAVASSQAPRLPVAGMVRNRGLYVGYLPRYCIHE